MSKEIPNRDRPALESLTTETVKTGREVMVNGQWRTICNMRRSTDNPNVVLFFKGKGLYVLRPAERLQAKVPSKQNEKPSSEEDYESQLLRKLHKPVKFYGTDVDITVGAVVFDVLLKEPGVVTAIYGGQGVLDLQQPGMQKWSVASARVRQGTKRDRTKLIHMEKQRQYRD